MCDYIGITGLHVSNILEMSCNLPIHMHSTVARPAYIQDHHALMQKFDWIVKKSKQTRWKKLKF